MLLLSALEEPSLEEVAALLAIPLGTVKSRLFIARKQPATHPAGQPPLVRQFKASVNAILRDGRTSESVVSNDPLNGHSLHVSTTINAMKQPWQLQNESPAVHGQEPGPHPGAFQRVRSLDLVIEFGFGSKGFESCLRSSLLRFVSALA